MTTLQSAMLAAAPGCEASGILLRPVENVSGPVEISIVIKAHAVTLPPVPVK